MPRTMKAGRTGTVLLFVVTMMSRTMKAGRRGTVQCLVLLFVVTMVTLNLRMVVQDSLYSDTGQGTDSIFDFGSDCRRQRPVIISMNGHVNQTARIEIAFSNDYLHRPTYNTSHAHVIGTQRAHNNFLTIGVPSIRRINGDVYIVSTVQSLVDESTAWEKLNSVAIVFLADYDQNFNTGVIAKLESRFKQYIQMGFIQIVTVSKDYYPKLAGLKQNFRDSVSRVQWRAKQVADYSFLFMYAQNQSQYYLQLEDDIRCAPDYMRDISQFIKLQDKRTPQWAILEFSELGFIGKLFKNADLPKLAQFMLTFYEEQPVDWLISYYRRVMTQNEILLRKPTLFQHVGKKSSFDTSKDNNLKDRFFAGGSKKWKTDDPPANVLSTMKHHENNFVQLVYASGSGGFWAMNPKIGDTVGIVFESAQYLKQVVVETGNDQHPVDILHSGTVELSSTLIKQNEKTGSVICANPKVVGHLEMGRCNVGNVTAVFRGAVRCLIVTVTSNQQNWIMFDQIGVFVEDT